MSSKMKAGSLKPDSTMKRQSVWRPKLARAHLNRGNALLALGDVEGAVAAFVDAISHDPTYAAKSVGGTGLALKQKRA